MSDAPRASVQQEIIPLLTETIGITRQVVQGATVRVDVSTNIREQRVDEAVVQERVSVERVSVGRYVDAIPSIRDEGDVTIIPVVEEVVVTEKRLFLREEVHIHRTRTTARHVETVTLREQEAVITRLPVRSPAGG